METITRRDFLRTSAAGAAGGAAAGGLLASVATGAPAGDAPPSPAAETHRFTRDIPTEAGFDLVVAGVPVHSFELQRPTLEEIFLKVVRGGPHATS